MRTYIHCHQYFLIHNVLATWCSSFLFWKFSPLNWIFMITDIKLSLSCYQTTRSRLALLFWALITNFVLCLQRNYRLTSLTFPAVHWLDNCSLRKLFCKIELNKLKSMAQFLARVKGWSKSPEAKLWLWNDLIELGRNGNEKDYCD